MFKRWLAILVFIGCLAPTAARALEDFDTLLLYRQLQIITNHVNKIHDSDNLDSVVAPGHSELIKNIDQKLTGQTVRFAEHVGSITEVSSTKVRIEGNFDASGDQGSTHWTSSGRNFFNFEKQGSKWLLTDTDFYKALGGSSGGGWWGNWPWFLALAVLIGLWFYVLSAEQRRAISRQLWRIIAAIWSWSVRQIRQRRQARGEQRAARNAAEPVIVEETSMPYEELEEPLESAAPSPHGLVHKPDPEEKKGDDPEPPQFKVHHFQDHDPEPKLGHPTESKNQLEHNLDEEKD
jgi:hypothetical protein